MLLRYNEQLNRKENVPDHTMLVRFIAEFNVLSASGPNLLKHIKYDLLYYYYTKLVQKYKIFAAITKCE